MFSVGEPELSTRISIAVMTTETACRYAGMSNVPAGVTNFSRLTVARLQAELSRNMYSLHGLDALMRAVFFDVCQRLIVVSNCMPGSPHSQVDSAILCMMSRALCFLTGWWSFTVRVQKSPSFS